jgi:hypothetical protein
METNRDDLVKPISSSNSNLILTRTAGRLGPQHGTRLGDATENLLTPSASKNRCHPAIRGIAVRNTRMAARQRETKVRWRWAP